MTAQFGRPISVGISAGHNFGSVHVNVETRNRNERISTALAAQMMNAAMRHLGEGAVSPGTVYLNYGPHPVQRIDVASGFGS
jgi:hypothetical protein